MKKYTILSGNGEYHGEFLGTDFKDAVINFKNTIPDWGIRNNIDINNLTYYGQKFYGNEIEE